jgi:flagellar biosynthesis chaperone FliJ
MNRERRKELAAVMVKLDEVINLLQQISEDEQNAFDNLPEGIQESERGEQMQSYADTISDIASTLEDQSLELDEIING